MMAAVRARRMAATGSPEAKPESRDANSPIWAKLATREQREEEADAGGDGQRRHRLLADIRQQLRLDVLGAAAQTVKRGLALCAQLLDALGGRAAGSAIAMFTGLGQLLGELVDIGLQLPDVGFEVRIRPRVVGGLSCGGCHC